MGTRALTFVYDESNTAIINLYSQYDGYPEGHGAEIAKFLSGKQVVNGLSGDTSQVFNGMGCLAAALVSHFKTQAGGFYLYPVGANDCGQDYEYHVYLDHVIVKNYSGRKMFSGTWYDFEKFCSSEEIA